MVDKKLAYVITNPNELKEILMMIFNDNLEKQSSEITEYVYSKSNASKTIINKIF